MQYVDFLFEAGRTLELLAFGVADVGNVVHGEPLELVVVAHVYGLHAVVAVGLIHDDRGRLETVPADQFGGGLPGCWGGGFFEDGEGGPAVVEGVKGFLGGVVGLTCICHLNYSLP
jgi:hypothetical protein